VEIPKKEYQKEDHKDIATMNIFETSQILQHDEVSKF
jgi:hypothetical protein